MLGFFTTGLLGLLKGGGVITMVEKTNRGWSEMGLGLLSHGSHLFIIGPMGTFVFFTLGWLDEQEKTTNNCRLVNLPIH